MVSDESDCNATPDVADRPDPVQGHLEGFRLFREMIRPEHRPRLDRIIRDEEKKMGMVPTDLDALYESVEASEAPTGTGGLLPEGEYQGVVLASTVGESVKPWVTAELKLKLQVDEGAESGKVTFCDIELAPNTDKSGQPSAGKLKFVKGQLAGLGYSGKLSEVEYKADSFIGARVAFRQKVDTHIDANGSVDQYARINPNTNQPYIDREVYLNELLAPGFGAPAASSEPSEPAVY